MSAEQEMSRSSYYSSTLIPELNKLNDACLWALQRSDQARVDEYSAPLTAAFKQMEAKEHNETVESILGRLPEQYDDKVHSKIKSFLSGKQTEYNRKFQYYSSLKDAKIEEMVNNTSLEEVIRLKQKYFNEALADWMLDRREVRQFEFIDNTFIQKKHPVYKEAKGKWGRSHFYAASKKFGPINIPTPVFNVIVMWLGIALLYLTLYLDILRRIIRYFETFRLRQLNKRLQRLGT